MDGRQDQPQRGMQGGGTPQPPAPRPQPPTPPQPQPLANAPMGDANQADFLRYFAGLPLGWPRTGAGDGTQGPKKPAVLPNRFDGTTDLEEFLDHFDLCVLANAWTPQEAGTFLGVSLDGVARRLLATVKPAAAGGYAQLRAALIQRFQPRCQTESYKAQLRTRMRKPGEPLQNLAEEVSRLVRLAYPDADAGTVDNITQDRMLDSIEDAELRHWIYQGGPKDLASAVTIGVQAEAYLTAERAKTQRVRGSTKSMAENMEDLKGSVDKWMSEKMERWMNTVSEKLDRPVVVAGGYSAPPTAGNAGRARNPGNGPPTGPPYGPRKCYGCGVEGHIRRNCPQQHSPPPKEEVAAPTKPAEN